MALLPKPRPMPLRPSADRSSGPAPARSAAARQPAVANTRAYAPLPAPAPRQSRHPSGARRVPNERRPYDSALSLGTGEFEVLLDQADVGRDPYDDEDDFNTACFHAPPVVRRDPRDARRSNSPRDSYDEPEPARMTSGSRALSKPTRPLVVPAPSVPEPIAEIPCLLEEEPEDDRDATRIGPVEGRSSPVPVAALSSGFALSGPALGYPLPLTPPQGVHAHVGFGPPRIPSAPRIPSFDEVRRSADRADTRVPARRAEKRSPFAFVLGLAAGCAVVGLALALVATNQLPLPQGTPKAITRAVQPVAPHAAGQGHDAPKAPAAPPITVAAPAKIAASPVVQSAAPVSPIVSATPPVSPGITDLTRSPSQPIASNADRRPVASKKAQDAASKFDAKPAPKAEAPRAEAKAKAAAPRVEAAKPRAAAPSSEVKAPSKLSASDLSDGI